MAQDSTPNNTAEQAARAAQDAAQNAAPQVPDTLELPPMLQNTDALEALMKKAAGQLN
jgi:hypothetical protein